MQPSHLPDRVFLASVICLSPKEPLTSLSSLQTPSPRQHAERASLCLTINGAHLWSPPILTSLCAQDHLAHCPSPCMLQLLVPAVPVACPSSGGGHSLSQPQHQNSTTLCQAILSMPGGAEMEKRVMSIRSRLFSDLHQQTASILKT
jgi:hypothetical protein